jgi:hypothetical protein
MKTKILSIVLTLAAIIGLTGCASTKPQTRARLVTVAQLAAFDGTKLTLIHHPEYRAGFELAAQELRTMEEGNIDALLLVEIINRLPVKELRGQTGALIVENASIILTSEIGATPLEKLNDLKPYVSAIRQGIERGLGQ